MFNTQNIINIKFPIQGDFKKRRRKKKKEKKTYKIMMNLIDKRMKWNFFIEKKRIIKNDIKRKTNSTPQHFGFTDLIYYSKYILPGYVVFKSRQDFN